MWGFLHLIVLYLFSCLSFICRAPSSQDCCRIVFYWMSATSGVPGFSLIVTFRMFAALLREWIKDLRVRREGWRGRQVLSWRPCILSASIVSWSRPLTKQDVILSTPCCCLALLPSSCAIHSFYSDASLLFTSPPLRGFWQQSLSSIFPIQTSGRLIQSAQVFNYISDSRQSILSTSDMLELLF